MTNILLIIIAIMVLVTMVCTIITTALVTKESKDNELVCKILKVFGIILVIAIVIGVAIGVSNIKKDDTNGDNNVETTELEKAGFNEVTLSEYLDLVKSSEKSIILVARPTCGYCQQFTPILKQAMEDMNLTINYIDTDKFSEDDWTPFTESLDYLKSEQWGTPLTLIVQNGEAIAENNGYVELDTIKEFFTNNGFGE